MLPSFAHQFGLLFVGELQLSSSQLETMAAAAKEKEKVVRASDEYVKKQQRLPPIRPPGLSESLFQAFPRLRELLRDDEAAIKSLIKMEEEILRQYHRKVLVYADVKVDDDDRH
ncbi:hypothetical protein SORBI_3005G197200 [Sorghum bicolor]|uniref:Uncharacterized protein n=1 Tax=Sorghum bicolor TaxID=4558 RepID=A0A1B6PTK3_SORBI|nr:hypothetical protein SORBI_3005G197200 [Sorghum bicolor]